MSFPGKSLKASIFQGLGLEGTWGLACRAVPKFLLGNEADGLDEYPSLKNHK